VIAAVAFAPMIPSLPVLLHPPFPDGPPLGTARDVASTEGSFTYLEQRQV
jgi:hypothetical protein